MNVRRAIVAGAVTGLVCAGALVVSSAAQALPVNGSCGVYNANLRYDRAGLNRAHASGDQHLINYYREQYNNDYLDAYRAGCV
ncbi:hypothetical protein J5X84_02765 [Streptosporangiaceae bacterium NEAU-GS5]|nr:hypothetical protein [Streptosporangiaceae bacterium NEAU-GS5]